MLFSLLPDDHLALSDDQNHSVYFSEWLLPSLSFLDKFIVKEVSRCLCNSLIEMLLKELRFSFFYWTFLEFCFGTCRQVSSLLHEVCEG